MRKVEFVYENYVKGLCPSVEMVVVDECGLKDIIFNTDEVNLIFQERDNLVLNVYASEDITVSEIQRMISGFKVFNVNLEFIKHSTIPFTKLCLIEFEVCSDE